MKGLLWFDMCPKFQINAFKDMEDASGKKMFNNYRNLQPRNDRNIIKVSNSDSYRSGATILSTSISALIILSVLHFY